MSAMITCRVPQKLRGHEMEEEKKEEEKPREEEPQEEKPDEKPKELKIIIFTSSKSEACKPALEEVKSIAEEEKVVVEEIDVGDLDFTKDMVEEGAGVPATCVVSGSKMECQIGYGPEYKQKLLEIMKKLRERIKSEQ